MGQAVSKSITLAQPSRCSNSLFKKPGAGDQTQVHRADRTWIGPKARTKVPGDACRYAFPQHRATWDLSMIKTRYCPSIASLIAFAFAASSYGQLSGDRHSAGTRVEISVADTEFAYRWCPAAEFKMGASEDARNEYGERFVPQHQVRISTGFWMQETEVTQLQYEKVMGKRPAFWHISLQSDNISQHPVEQITWFDATEYCVRLSKMDAANDYRLPTEAEWEYACRAGTTTARYGDLNDIAWYFQTTDDGEGSSGHRRVGKKKPNAWGLFDMLGNVGEWCSDWHGPLKMQFAIDPTGPQSGGGRIVRGDDCFADCSESFPGCLAGARASWRPGEKSRTIGFRVVRLPAISTSGKGGTKP